MSVHENFDVQYHQQDTSYYCGGACAQMVLEQIGAGILDQDDLYADNHAHSTAESGWYTGPDGLAWTLNDRRPASFTNSFVLFALDSEDLISRKLCWTLHHYQVAPVALVYGWAHWIVVRGYQASEAPSSSGDDSYTITAFDVNNPWPPTPTPAPPPPHTGTDACGGGGDRGIADEHVSYATWQADYMTGVPGGHWSGKFVAVCDPEPPARRVGPQRRPRESRQSLQLLSSAEAARAAVNGLEQYGLHDRPNWVKALKGAKAAAPVLVQRLDRPDSFYYVVPMRASAKRTPAMVAVDAISGAYRQAIALPSRGNVPSLELTRTAVAKMLVDRRFQLGDCDDERLGRLLVRKEAMCIYPTLVWKPCRESLSPYWPFFMVTVGAHRIYVRVDGAVFTQLHDNVRGI